MWLTSGHRLGDIRCGESRMDRTHEIVESYIATCRIHDAGEVGTDGDSLTFDNGCMDRLRHDADTVFEIGVDNIVPVSHFRVDVRRRYQFSIVPEPWVGMLSFFAKPFRSMLFRLISEMKVSQVIIPYLFMSAELYTPDKGALIGYGCPIGDWKFPFGILCCGA